MFETKDVRALLAACLLLSGPAAADGAAPASVAPAAVAAIPPGASAPPAAASTPPVPPSWIQTAAAMQVPVYYMMVPPGMMWPSYPPFPAYGMILRPAYVPWFPFPLTPPQPTADPAVAEYGPVAETPVVELPPPEAVAAPDPQEPPPRAPADAGTGASAAVPVIGRTPSAEEGGPLGATQSTAPVADAAPPGAAPSVDYGPVAATPVVDLIALERQPQIAPSPDAAAPKTPRKRVHAPAAAPQAAPRQPAQPPKRRLCWTNGVVAPCR